MINRLATSEIKTTRLQLKTPALKLSASENALGVNNGDDKISEKNLKPEILMDLSKLSADDDKQKLTLFEEDESAILPRKRKLSRVSSDSACRNVVRADAVKFKLGGDNSGDYSDDEPPSLRHSQTDLVSFGLERHEQELQVHEVVKPKVVIDEEEKRDDNDGGMENLITIDSAIASIKKSKRLVITFL